MPFALPTGSDNTSAEAGLNSLFTTTEPLSRFLRLAATWAEARQVELVVSRVSGERSQLADDLSRERFSAVAGHVQDRVRFSLHSLQALAQPGHCLSLHPPDAAWDDNFLPR